MGAAPLPTAGREPGLLRTVLLVAVIAVVVYLSAIPGDFCFDDKLIQRDPRIHGQTSFWTIFVTDYWYTYIGTSADLYRPLTIASYALNYAVTGLSSPAFHVVNVGLHALFCVLLVYLLDVLLRDRSLAVVSGLLFATHPVHTEAVTGIVGRAEVLSALFLLGALYLHARDYTLKGWGQAIWLPVAGVLYFCALLSKETAIVGIGLLVVVEVTKRLRATLPGANEAGSPSRAARAAPASIRVSLGVLGLYIGVACLYVYVRFLVVGGFLQKPPAKEYYLLFGQPLLTRLLTGMKVFAIYLRLLFFPVTLSADYSYNQVPLSHSVDSVAIAIGLLATACLGAVFAWAWTRRVIAVVFALGFFAAAYSVVSNLIVPIGVLVAERLLYLPSVGFCVGIAWVGLMVSRRYAPLLRGSGARYAPAGVLAVVLLLYSARTIIRNFDWSDQETLYAATVRDSPNCHAALFNYSAVLMQTSKRPDRKELALAYLLRGYEIRRDNYPSLVNLTILYLGRGELEQARKFALEGLQVRPDSTKLKGLLKTIEARLPPKG